MKTKEKKSDDRSKGTVKQSVKEMEHFTRNSCEDCQEDFVCLQLQSWGTMDHYIKERIHSNY